MHPFTLMPWWGWLFAGGSSAMVAIAAAMFQDERGRPIPIIVGAIGAISAFVCGGIGVVLFIRWMWFS